LKNRRYSKFTVLTLLILFFMIFFRLSASVVRAGIMLIIYYGAEVFMRKGSTANSMGAAILIITLFQPYACMDIGFLLSITGTFGIGVLAPYFCRRIRKNGFYGIKCLIIGSLCATLCSFPISGYFFGGISIIGVFMNLLLYPLFFPALIFMTLFALTLGTGNGFLFPAGLLAKAMIWIINLFGDFKFSYIPIDSSFILYISIASVVFTAAVYFYFQDSKRTAMAIGLSLCVMTGCLTFSHFYNTDKVKLSMYSDGSAACVIVKNGANAYAVASGDTPKIELYIKEYMRNEFLDELTSVSLLQSENNNEKAFASLPCQCYSPPGENNMLSSESGVITVINRSKSCLISINNISISVSPASEPLEADISVLYGYKKNIPQMPGRVFCSSRRIGGDGITNIYYENSNYYITKTGVMEKIN
ncbi:MAG: ComEC/Rec2 family competence protein, partial [[Eubacterium] siraeum]|nr:ComEC/Rec2 family competence protein [[Eubacterium] siraeum]